MDGLEKYALLMDQSYKDDDPNDYCTERYALYPNLLSPQQCLQAVEMFETFDNEEGVVGYNYGSSYIPDHDLRKCSVTYVPNNNQTRWLHDILESALYDANKIWRFNIHDCSQPMRMMGYGPSDHFQSWHMDHGPGQTSYRKLTLVLQLDKPEIDFKGGEFEIAGGGIPDEYYQQGCAIVFPTYYYHRVLPITDGFRRTVVHRAIGPRFQ